MNVIKKIITAAFALCIILAITTAAVYSLVYESWDDFTTDFRVAKRAVWLELFNRGYATGLSQEDVRYIYQKRCYRQCHGEAAMITAVLSQAGWFQVVERMRVKENVEITGREADVIIRYLEETYPSTISKYSYETRKKVHEAVWRNDMGQGDIYCDVIYVTEEYLASVGAENAINDYELDDYHVFVISFSVHEGEVPLQDLDNIAYLNMPAGKIDPAPPWKLRFQTADKHHYEAEVRFRKEGSPGWLELVLRGVGGPDDRVYHWDMPITYPEEVQLARGL